MRIDRLEVATSTDSMEMRLHPRITLVTGLGRLEREALTAEIATVLGTGRPGLNAELLEDTGRILLVERPIDGPPRVVDALNGENVSESFRTENEAISIAGSLGVRQTDLRSFLRLGAVNLKEEEHRDELIRRLGRLDQDRLWAAALTLAEVEVEVAKQSGESQSSSRHELYADAIEECHLAVERAHERLENTRAALTASSAALALLAFIGVLILHPIAALPFLALSMFCGGAGYYNYRQLEQARKAEVHVLNAAGLESYFNLQLIQVEALTARREHRTGAIKLHEIHRYAKECWQQLVGTVPLEWAVAHRTEIEAAARGLYRGTAPVTNPAEMVDRIQRHLDRAGSRLGESLPALLDDPFTILDDFDLAAVLSMITDHAHIGQVVLLTDDQRVRGWADQLADRFAAAVLELGAGSGLAPRSGTVEQQPQADEAAVRVHTWG
ncbi:MAG: hypothetical protein HKN24_01475 [Acidimicrobiales bacterium]|nr:hypothetical protein [Acidimicrobiales bacterium]